MSEEPRREPFEIDDGHTNFNNTQVISSLPAADGGWAAWLFLTGSFMIETLLWGFPFSFGVLQDYYSTHEPFSSHAKGVSTIGTTCSGIMYCAAPLLFAVYTRYPQFVRQSTFIGLPIVSLAIFLSSFATSIWHLTLTQGVMYAIGGGLLYYPVFIFIDEWFVRRKGFAFGVMWAGSGCGGLGGPLVLDWGLDKYGPKVFLRGWAVALLILTGPLLYFVRPRLPISHIRQTPPRFRTGFGFVKTRAFWALQVGNVIQGLGYFIPALYLPSYARALRLSSTHGSLIVAVLNTASVPGVILLSALSDRIHVSNVILISTLGSAISVFLLWGLSSASTAQPLLLIFAITYGFFAGGFTATYAGMVRELRRVTPPGAADLGSMFGLLSAGRGLGNVMCGPISELLLQGRDGKVGRKEFAYGSSYSLLVIFTGTTAVLAVTPWVTRKLHLV